MLSLSVTRTQVPLGTSASSCSPFILTLRWRLFRSPQARQGASTEDEIAQLLFRFRRSLRHTKIRNKDHQVAQKRGKMGAELRRHASEVAFNRHKTPSDSRGRGQELCSSCLGLPPEWVYSKDYLLVSSRHNTTRREEGKHGEEQDQNRSGLDLR
jgi:hypothetical protein